MKPCPICGSSDNPKFVAGSDWCAPCAGDTLDEQAREDHRKVKPQLFKV